MRRRHCAFAVLVLLLIASTDASAGNGNGPESSPGQSAPINSGVPSISGNAIVGSTLSAIAGAWMGPAPAYGYQWARCASNGGSCSPISSATGQTYGPDSGDVGSTLRVTVSASNKNGTAVATSDPTAPVAGPAQPSPSSTTTSMPASTTASTTTTTTTTTTATAATPTATAAATTSTTTPTSQPSPPIGSVFYSANWESGVLDDGAWGHQCADNTPINSEGTRRGTYTVISGDTSSGSYAGRFDLPATATYSQACEALHSRLAGPGTDDYYALAIKFPTNWQSDSTWGMAVVQFNYEGVSGAPLGLVVHPNNAEIVVNTGDCSGPCQYYSGNGYNRVVTGGPFYAIPPARFTLGGWHQLVVHVHWTLATDGFVEVWHRYQGQSAWTKTVSGSGFPTLQTGTRWDGYLVTQANIASFGTTDKFGAYRGAASYPMSVFHDDWCRATSFAAAAGCLG